MKYKLLIIPSVLTFSAALAQNGTASLTASQANVTMAATPAPTVTLQPADSALSPADPSSTKISLLDYKSVYEAATLDEEVQMATERFALTPSQQDVWREAATDRRAAEKQAREKLEAKKGSYERDGAYRGIRTSQNEFHELITGYLTPTQKQALEADRLVLEEKRKKIAKLPPPAPAPTVTVAPVDSAAIKEGEKAKNSKGTAKKSKRKKKAVQQ